MSQVHESQWHNHRCPNCYTMVGPCTCKSTYWLICSACASGVQTRFELKVTGPGQMPTRTHPDDAGLDLYTFCDPEYGSTQEQLNRLAGIPHVECLYKNPDDYCTPANFVGWRYRLLSGVFADIDTGIAVQLPPGTWADIAPRSSTIRKRNLLVPSGVIDVGYRGRLYVPVLNIGSGMQIIEPGTRLGQLVIMPNLSATVQPIRVEKLDDSERGTKGFGSSGE